MQERRSEQRLMCADLVMVNIRESEQPRRETVANLEDISPSGACVQLDAAVRQGANIEIVCGKCRLKGTVSYCRFSETGYDVGVRFNEARSWSRARFTPRHLLDIPAPWLTLAKDT